MHFGIQRIIWEVCIPLQDLSTYFFYPTPTQKTDINIYSIYGKCLPDPNATISRRTRRRRLSILPPQHYGWSGCWGSDVALSKWLNNEDVRKSLHVHDSPLSWKVCQDFPLFNYTKTETNVVSLYSTFLQNNVNVLIYSGMTFLSLSLCWSARTSLSLSLTHTHTHTHR